MRSKYYTMVIISRYEIIFNSRGEYAAKSVNPSVCPICGGSLFVRDSRLRICIREDGHTVFYRIRRLRCKECAKIHTELPDCIMPFKRYGAACVENAVDGHNICPAEESTVRRWKRWLQTRSGVFEEMLTAQWQNQHLRPANILSAPLFFQELRNAGAGWLSKLTRHIVNCGYGLHTCFAFCP